MFYACLLIHLLPCIRTPSSKLAYFIAKPEYPCLSAKLPSPPHPQESTSGLFEGRARESPFVQLLLKRLYLTGRKTTQHRMHRVQMQTLREVCHTFLLPGATVDGLLQLPPHPLMQPPLLLLLQHTHVRNVSSSFRQCNLQKLAYQGLLRITDSLPGARPG